MKVQLGGARQGGGASTGTKSIEAHDHYLRGIALWQRRREAELWQAVEAFESAIAADPTYASAYGGLGLVYSVIGDYSARISYQDTLFRATDAAEMALALDPSLPEAYAALANAANVTDVGRPHARCPEADRTASVVRHGASVARHRDNGRRRSGCRSRRAGARERTRSALAGRRGESRLRTRPRSGATPRRVRSASESSRWSQTTPGANIASGWRSWPGGNHGAARPFLLRAAELQNPSAEPLVRVLLDALDGRGDRQPLARRLTAYPTHVSSTRVAATSSLTARSPLCWSCSARRTSRSAPGPPFGRAIWHIGVGDDASSGRPDPLRPPEAGVATDRVDRWKHHPPLQCAKWLCRMAVQVAEREVRGAEHDQQSGDLAVSEDVAATLVEDTVRRVRCQATRQRLSIAATIERIE